MKYFRIFNNHSDYEDFRGSDDYPTYNISLCLEEGDVHLSEEKNSDYSEKCFTIESLEDNNEIIIKRHKNSNTSSFTLNYSTDNGNRWETVTLPSASDSESAVTVATINSGDKLLMRKDRNETSKRFSTSDSSYASFSIQKECNIYGNIMSLIKDDFTTQYDVEQYSFYYLFDACNGIISAEDLVLPSLVVKAHGYRGMFDKCANLVKVPKLPATTLEGQSYRSMFGNCSSLEYAPELMATTIGSECCRWMFGGCTSLKTAPSILRPTKLTESCYFDMFNGCTSLTTVPQLPATTLAKSCYQSMFKGCTSLTIAPQLLATTVANSCYREMFQGCTSLTTTPELAATNLSGSNYCYHTMFKGCTSLATVPILSATTLSEYCYEYMFQNCSGLTTVPTNMLPATTLASYCYYGMFLGCTNLTTVPELPATTLAPYCYNGMFNDCKGLTTVPSNMLPATTLAGYCYSTMFGNCRELTTAPELPATTLVDGCYYQMFKECAHLNYIKCLATDISANQCTHEWVYHVQNNGGTFVKYITMKDWTRDTNGILTNWTIEDYSDVHVTGVSLSSTAETITKGNTVTLTATVSPNDAYVKSVTWSSNDTSVATVSSEGVVTAVGCGNATITVTTTDGGYTAQCATTVENPITGVTLNNNIIYVMTSSTYQLEATVIPSDACEDKSVTWSTSDASVATVSNNGLVTAIATGTAVVTVTTSVGSYTASCSVNVTAPVAVTSVTLSDNSLTIIKDNTYTLSATVLPNDALDKSVTWSSSDSNVASVDSNGVVSGVASGSATITVTTVDGGFTAQCSVTVNETRDYSLEYFTIESLANNNTIKMDKSGSPSNISLSYSLDNGSTWTDLTISASLNFAKINSGDKILFKGTNNRLATAWNSYYHFHSTNNFKAYGNIMSLFNGDDFKTNYEFNSGVTNHCAGLFRTTYLVDASNLILPASTLYTNSYNGMFRGATALQHGPQMLATTPTGTECCSSMFEECKNLEEPIEINFTTLSQQCCMRMFCMSRTTKLTTPKMTKSPILRCNTAAIDCYKEMFKGNGNLNEITCLLTNNVSATVNWVQYAGADTGTFYKHPDKTWTQGQAYGVPTGWTIEDYTE